MLFKVISSFYPSRVDESLHICQDPCAAHNVRKSINRMTASGRGLLIGSKHRGGGYEIEGGILPVLGTIFRSHTRTEVQYLILDDKIVYVSTLRSRYRP